MSHILIVGKNFSGIKEYLLAHGHEYTVLQDELATKFPDKRLKNRVVTSFKDKASVINALNRIKSPIDGVLCIYENYIVATAWITQYLQLPGMNPEAAEACTDKELMRQRFSESPIKISPAFKAVRSEIELIEFANAHEFPLILKPANLAKSLLVTKNENLDELIANYKRATELLGSTYAKYAPNRAPKLIVEEFLDGTIHSVDAFIDSTGEPHILDQLVDYQTGYDIGYSDNFHYSRILPSALAQKDKDELIKVAAQGCRSLSMQNTPAHIEIILTKDGPRIVEIGARNGGYRERMHSYANGIDIAGNHIALCLGQQPNITATENNACAVLELFPRQPGIYKGISNFDILKSLPSTMYVSEKAKNGSFVGKSSDGYKMCAVVMLGNSNHDTLRQDLEFINSNVSVMTTDS
jgi:carbamoylphosphate synthase large subunit